MAAASVFDFSELPPMLAPDERAVEGIVKSVSNALPEGEDRKSALSLILSCIDLTTLEGCDTAQKVRALCRKAECPHPSLPSAAAVCVYGPLVRDAKDALLGSTVKVASVTAHFPSGMAPLQLKLEETKFILSQGADEIDMVISRGAFLEGRHDVVYDEISAVRKICSGNCLKVILETGELGSLENVRRASDLALYAGADFIKTSTGKVQPGASFPAAVVMLQALKDFEAISGKKAGFKPSGGISSAEQALIYFGLVRSICGSDHLSPDFFRVGASRLLDVIVAEIL